MSSVDDILLNNSEEDYAARKMRESKSPNEPEAGGKYQSLRQNIAAARRVLDLKERAKEKLEKKISDIGSKLSLNALWGFTSSVIGFLPGILFIDTIVFMKATGMTFKIADKIKFKLKDILLLILFNVILGVLILFIVSFFVDKDILKTMQSETKTTTQPSSLVK